MLSFILKIVLIQALVEMGKAQSCGGNPSLLTTSQCQTVSADATIVAKKGLG
jgi:hypothetical protein